jgi:signal transduction histidine kinase
LSRDRLAINPPVSEAAEGGESVREKPGARTHVLLVLAMALIIAVVTGISLLLIRHQLRNQVTDNLSADLDHSVAALENMQAERLEVLERENALLAELPTLKALMTSGDDLTIQNGTREFWGLSGADLFVIADPSGRVIASYSAVAMDGPSLRDGLRELLASPAKHYLIVGDSLYACAFRPLYFGSEAEGTLLGYVVSGVSVESTVREISEPAGVEVAFLSGSTIVASTLARAERQNLSLQAGLLAAASRAPTPVRLGNARFLSASRDLSTAATSPLELVVLKSFEPAERSISRIDRMVLFVGLLALFSGTALMMIVSRLVTQPLEELSNSVHALGMGDVEYRVPRHGTQEVQELSTAFLKMRSEIQKANQQVLESERLATIGRMARSVSHDLRHYLAAIYANSEFLVSDRYTAKERAEIFGEISTAVSGTTEMIESLLIFSRTGASLRRHPERMATLVEKAVALVRTHPDTEGVTLIAQCGDPAETVATVDGKQIERAISNLILNACQSARNMGTAAMVVVTVEAHERQIVISITDNGPGVPGRIRDSLFDPFVSEGKQKGTGLGLTLAHCVAVEHGGEVVLVSSRPGETIFQMKVARSLLAQDEANASEAERDEQVIPDENVPS